MAQRGRGWLVLLAVFLGCAVVMAHAYWTPPPPPEEPPPPIARATPAPSPSPAILATSVEVVALTYHEGAPWLAKPAPAPSPEAAEPRSGFEGAPGRDDAAAPPPDGFQLCSMPPPPSEYPALQVTARDAAGQAVPGPEVLLRELVDPQSRQTPPTRFGSSGLIPLPLPAPVASSRLVVTVEGSSTPPLILDSWELYGLRRPIFARTTFVVDGGQEPGGEVAGPFWPGEGLPADFDEAAERTAVEAAVREWREAWQSRDRDRYLRSYDPDFWSQDGKWDLASWGRRKAASFVKTRRIRLRLSGLKVSFPRADLAEVEFLQEYEGDSYRDIGDKSLLLRRGEAGWRILMEEFRDNPEARLRQEQDRRLRTGIPVQVLDEAERDADLYELRRVLLQAVAARDAEFLGRYVVPGRRRDGRTLREETAFEEMRRNLELDDPEAEAWEELERVLRGGGAFLQAQTHEGMATCFVAPYVSARGPKEYQRPDVVLVDGEDVQVRREPTQTAPVVRALGYVLVQLDESAPFRAGWKAILLPDGSTGWVAERFLRRAFDRRAWFVKKEGVWWLSSFQGGC